jgi:hypothetical protein
MIKASKSPAEAKVSLTAQGWSLGDVAEMLERSVLVPACLICMENKVLLW